MDDQAKFQRMLSLMLLLSGGRSYTVPEVTARFNMSERTFYRYLATYREAGLIVEPQEGRYRIRKIEPKWKEISELLHFSDEEAMILNKAILAIHDDNTLKANLVKKLYALYDFDRVADTIVKPEQSENIHALLSAIRQKRQVILRDYQSAHAQEVRDRIVEPFYFTTNYQSIWTYDTESQDCKQFKISRIAAVVITPQEWKFTERHHLLPSDPFRISGGIPTPVSVKLSLRAYSLMIEEYPLSEPHITQKSKTDYLFQGPVYGFEGIGRFCLGLCDQVKVLDPPAFITYLKEKVKNNCS